MKNYYEQQLARYTKAEIIEGLKAVDDGLLLPKLARTLEYMRATDVSGNRLLKLCDAENEAFRKYQDWKRRVTERHGSPCSLRDLSVEEVEEGARLSAAWEKANKAVTEAEQAEMRRARWKK